MNQAFNPYLPDYEYIPDGEPHVFGDRVYVYGSHDRFDGKKFCLNDYVCYSAPVTDLADWRYEGVIYKKTQDPRMADGTHELWAPDVVRGKDGRYYLYYCPDDKIRSIGVAVCETPAGSYEFYGLVKDQDGGIIGERPGDTIQFDPGVFIDDDGKIYLYSGNGPRTKSQIGKEPKASVVMELNDDMMTVKVGPKKMLPVFGEEEGTGFEGHAFFEASSIRKIGGKYYLVYSSNSCHELCYAISDRPDGGWKFGGVLVSNCDVFPEGNQIPRNCYGNNHGGLEYINGKYYIFYHRQTNRSSFSRQGCAEEVTILEDGSIPQVEITSCGLNGRPLSGEGVYPASIACWLYGKVTPTWSHPMAMGMRHPFITQDGPDHSPEEGGQIPRQYIANVKDGLVAAYKYFDLQGNTLIRVKVRGKATGKLLIRTGEYGPVLGEIELSPAKKWTDFQAETRLPEGKYPLFLSFRGKGTFDFLEFELKPQAAQEESTAKQAKTAAQTMPPDMDKKQSFADIARLIFKKNNPYKLDDRFVLRDDKKHPFALIIPGGGYTMVCSFMEGVPIARKLNEKGVSCFILYYSVGKKAKYPAPQKDVARAITEIFAHAYDYQVETEGYSIWGASAGGHLTASFGTTAMGYVKYDLPKPATLILSYPVITMENDLTHAGSRQNLIGDDAGKELTDFTSVEKQVDEHYPATYIWCGDADTLVPPENTKRMAKALEENGIPFECHIFPGVAHGVGPATDTSAEGWIDQAVDFWLANR